VRASGLVLAGIGPASGGLAAGLATFGLERLAARGAGAGSEVR
jgi:predicted benzoate:H+ symporter BenE